MAAAAPINTVEASLQLCGVPNAPLFGGQTPATRVAEQVFMNAFDTCLSISIEDVKDAITGFTKLPATNGRVPFQPGVKRSIIAFVQWTRTELRCGRDPANTAFPIGDAVQLHQDLKSCANFKNKLIYSLGKPNPNHLMYSYNGWIGHPRL